MILDKHLCRLTSICTLVILSFSPILYAQDAIIRRAMEAAEDELIAGHYERAYIRARLILRFYGDKALHPDALAVTEQVVEAYTKDLATGHQWRRLVEVEAELAAAPPSVRNRGQAAFDQAQIHTAAEQQERVQQQRREQELQRELDRLSELENLQEQELERQRQSEALRRQERLEFEQQQERLRFERGQLDTAQQARIDQILELNRRLEEERERSRQAASKQFFQRQNELEQARTEQEARLREQFERILENTVRSSEQAVRTTESFGYMVMIGLGAAGLIVAGFVVLLVVITLRQQKIQQQQFNTTIRTFQAMQSVQLESMYQVAPYAPSPNGNLALPIQTPGLFTNDQNMRHLLEQCYSYAAEIDKISRRKNAAKAVAEFVYKIAIASGIKQDEALLYYAAGLVYDIGFLNIDSDILASRTISEEQFKTIKTHTTIGLNMVFFVPEEHRPLFKNAVSKHHENLDGTGYPYGLKQKSIPYIARILRVVESYIALISTRDYRDIMDREAAFEELYAKPNHYDLEIVQLLDNLT